MIVLSQDKLSMAIIGSGDCVYSRMVTDWGQYAVETMDDLFLGIYSSEEAARIVIFDMYNAINDDYYARYKMPSTESIDESIADKKGGR